MRVVAGKQAEALVRQLEKRGATPAVVTLAPAEGLKAHADSIRARYAHA